MAHRTKTVATDSLGYLYAARRALGQALDPHEADPDAAVRSCMAQLNAATKLGTGLTREDSRQIRAAATLLEKHGVMGSDFLSEIADRLDLQLLPKE